MRRFFAMLALIALAPFTMPAVTDAGHAHARPASSTMLQYVNMRVGYAISYPSDWKKQPGTGTDLYLQATDGGLLFEVSSGKLHLRPAQIRDYQKRNLASVGTVQGPITYSIKTINGFVFHLAEGAVKLKDGSLTDVFWMDRNHKGYFFDLGAEIKLKGRHADAETAQLGAMINSVIFFS